jgi:hypothetical protein
MKPSYITSASYFLGITIFFLLFSFPIHALTPPSGAAYDAWANIESYSPSSIRLNVSYSHDIIIQQAGRPGGAGSQSQYDYYGSTMLPLGGALLELSFDGSPLLDSSGAPACPNLITAQRTGLSGGQVVEEGEAVCTQPSGFYAKSPYPADGGKPIPISSWPRCAFLEVKLLSSPKVPIKAFHSSPLLICPSASKLSNLWAFLGLAQLKSNPALIAACLPLVIIFGLLMASMYYQGRDPLSLLDITTPRLPSMRKVRVKPAVVPLHLASKGRLSDRYLRNIEKSMGSILYDLYKRHGKGDPRGKLKDILSTKKIGYVPGFLGKIPATQGQNFKSTLLELEKLVDASGASEREKRAAKELLLRHLQAREALIVEKDVHSWARGGGRTLTRKIIPTVDFIFSRLAKPWKLIPGVANKEWADKLPGLPYIERTGLVITNWFAGRAGNVSLRQQIRRALTAEVGVKLGLLDREKSEYAKKHLFDNRKIGNIPNIIEKLRNETYVFGVAVVDEHARALITAAVLRREEGKDGVKFVIDQKRLEQVLKMLKEAQEKAGENKLEMRRLFAQSLLEFASKNLSSMRFIDAAGNELSNSEKLAFLEQAKSHIFGAIRIIQEDGQATKNGLLPIFNTDATRKMNPEDVFGRYNKMIALLDAYKQNADQIRAGKVPLVFFNNDLAELIGRAIAAKELSGKIKIQSEAHRLFEIRRYMEEEYARRKLYDVIIGADVRQVFDGSKLSPQWLSKVREALSVQALRAELDYAKRGEWAARNYLTGYNTNNRGYWWEAERNKIEIIRQALSNSIGMGQENLLRNYWTQIDRNKFIYYSMKELCEFYLGKKWSAEAYEEWKARGVLYKDIQKGVWLIGDNRLIIPLPSNILRDASGNIVGVLVERDKGGWIKANMPSKIAEIEIDGRKAFVHGAFSFMISDYADRPVNLALLFKTESGKWKPGSPTDRETQILFQQQKAAYLALSSPAYGSASKDWRAALSPSELEALASGRAMSREKIWENIRRIEEMLGGRVQAVPRSALPYLSGELAQSWWTRGMARITQGLERVMIGGAADTVERLHAWYAAQAYARVLLMQLQSDISSGQFYSEPVQNSLKAKEELGKLRQEQLRLLSTPNLSPEQKQELERLRARISELSAQIPQLEKIARQYQKEHAFVDRNLKRVADMAIPFYNVNEQVNMRDPRVAWGGGYGMGPAVMVGYQTGQFVGERPQMWAGYNLFPGDRWLNILARPSYWASMAFGMWTRPFFTKLVGYTTVYHVDPERGISGSSWHEPGIAEGVRSLFRPSQSFDWLTRFYPFPVWRGFGAYKDEFGWKIKEEGGWRGVRYISPVTWLYGKGPGGRGGGTDELAEVDIRKYSMLGLNAGEVLRTKKLGRTFREEYLLWSDDAHAAQEAANALRSNIPSITDPNERRIAQAQLRIYEDIANPYRRIWNIPGIGAFFRQGYWAVENRTGYDISAVGGSHRPWEMLSPYYKNIASAPVPGMVYVDWSGQMKLFGRLAQSILNPTRLPPSNLYDMWQAKKSGSYSSSPLSGFSNLSAGSYEPIGIAHDLQRDALLDTYRRETPTLAKFFDIDMQRQAFSFQNSEFVIPLAPLYLAAYQIFRHKSSWARKQPWNSLQPREKDIGEPTQEQLKQEEMRRLEQYQAAQQGQLTYRCPTHGINLQIGQSCPLCRSEEAYRMEKEQSSTISSLKRRAENLKSLVISSFSLSKWTDPNYYHYENQAHCPIHGVGYLRGTACPLCLSELKAKSGGEAKDNIRRYQETLSKYAKKMQEIEFNPILPESEKGRKLLELERERESELGKIGIQIDRDTRMGYRQGLAYLRAMLEEVKKLEATTSYKVEIE